MTSQTIRFHINDENSEKHITGQQWEDWLISIILYAGYVPTHRSFFHIVTPTDRSIQMDFMTESDYIIDFKLEFHCEGLRKYFYFFKTY